MSNDIYEVIENMQDKSNNKTLSYEDYMVMKEQEKAEVFNMLDEITESIISDDEKFNEYLAVQVRLGKYTVSNTMLIFAQKPEASLLKDFEAWKDSGVKIRKGEKSIKILEPYSATSKDGGNFTVFNVKKLLDVSQTNAQKFVRKPHIPDRIILGAAASISPYKIEVAEETPYGKLAVTENNIIKVKKGLESRELIYAVMREAVSGYIDRAAVQQEENTEFQKKIAEKIICMEYGLDEGKKAVAVPEEMKLFEPKEFRRELSKAVEVYNKVKETERQLTAEEKEKQKDNRER